MNAVFVVGAAAQVLFSARLLVQWIRSERLQRVLTPEIFWELSLAASILMFLYGWLRNDFAIMVGQTLTYFIYIRNLQLQNRWQHFPLFFRAFLFGFPFMVVWYGYHNGHADIGRLFYNHAIPHWLIVWGVLAHLLFTLRFVYQWARSERRGHSHLPMGFWLISLLGSGMILIYAILRKDPVLFAGQAAGFVIYIRNIRLLRQQKRLSSRP